MPNDTEKQAGGSRRLLSLPALSSDGVGRFWRGKQKLGLSDLSLQERVGSGDGERTSIHQGASTEYRTYKRRWFGLAQLTLMNIIVSWDVRSL